MSLTPYKYMHIIASNHSHEHNPQDGCCSDCMCKCFLEQSYSPLEYIFMAITKNPKRHERMCVCGHSYAEHFQHNHRHQDDNTDEEEDSNDSLSDSEEEDNDNLD